MMETAADLSDDENYNMLLSKSLKMSKWMAVSLTSLSSA